MPDPRFLFGKDDNGPPGPLGPSGMNKVSLDYSRDRAYSSLAIFGGKTMIRNQPGDRPLHEISIQFLRLERRTEKRHLEKLKDDLRVKLPPVKEEQDGPKSA
jgi:hypothetical protein